MDYEIKWIGQPMRDLEAALREEIDVFTDGNANHIITHTMMVGGTEPGSNGPSVSASWDEEENCLVAQFYPVTEWVTLTS